MNLLPDIVIPSLEVATGRLACDARKLGYCAKFDEDVVRDLLARGAPAGDLLIASRNDNFSADDFKKLREICMDRLFSGLCEKPNLVVLAASFSRRVLSNGLSEGLYILIEYLLAAYDYSGDELSMFYRSINWKGYLTELKFVKLLVKRDLFFSGFGGYYSGYGRPRLPELRIILGEGLIKGSERDWGVLRICDTNARTMVLERPEYEINSLVSKIFSQFLSLHECYFWFSRIASPYDVKFVETTFIIDQVFCHV